MSKKAYNKIAEGLKEVVTMNAAQKRLAILKELLANEPDQNSLYAQDLKLSIAQAEIDVRNASPDGYRMVS